MARIYYPGSPDAHAGQPVLRLDQLEAVHRIKQEITDPERSGSVLVGASMGSGKTVICVEVIMMTNPRRALIVGVRDAYSQWQKTLHDQGSDRELLRIDNTTLGRGNLAKLIRGDEGLYYVGLEMLRAQDWEVVSETYPVDPVIKKFFAKLGEDIGDTTEPVKKARQLRTYADMPPVDLLISDESHKHSNQKSAAIKTIRTIPAKAKIALSGTFFGNKFENAWSLTVWLWGKGVIGGKGAWEARWAVKEPVTTKDGKKQLTTPGGFPLTKIVAERNPGEFVESLPCYVFIATPIGAPPEPETVYVDLTAEQMRQYEEMERQSLTWIPSVVSEVREPLVADLPLTQRGRLRTAALGGMTLVPGADEDDPDSIIFEPGSKSSTLNAAYDVLHRPSWAGQKALILTHSKQFAIEAARRIGQKYNVALKTGDTKPSEWERQKESFMRPVSETGSVQYLVAVISAVGTATDGLQRHCSKVLWLSKDENVTNNIQASNRIWRDGVDLDRYEAVEIVQRGTISEGILTKNNRLSASILGSVAGT